MKKRLKILSVLVLIYVSLTIFYSSNVYAGTLKMKNIDIDATVNEDSSMDVVETWKIYVSETNTLFKNFEKDKTKYSSIDNVSVTDITNDIEFGKIYNYMYHVTKNKFYALDVDSDKFEIAWGISMDNTSGTRTYQIKYTVRDAVSIHNDCAELYWQFIGKSNEIPIEEINGTIKLPGNLNKEDIKVWGHTESLNGIIYPTNEGNIKFTLENIPTNEYVEIRTTFSKDAVWYSQREDTDDVLEDIISEETEWANEANIKREKRKIIQTLIYSALGIVAGILALIQIIFPIKKLKNADKKITPTVDVDYFRDLPRDDATPAEALTIMNKSTNAAILDFPKTFSATLMNLNIKKFIKFEIEKNEKGKETIKILLGDNEQDIDTLKQDEKQIYLYIKKAIESKEDKVITVKQLQKYIESKPAEISKLRTKILDNELKYIKDNDYVNQKDVLKRDKILGIQTLLPILAFFGLIFILASEIITISYPVTLIIFGYAIATIIGWIISKIAVSKLNLHTQKGVDEINQWQGLKRFMNDFSQMDKKDLPSIVIWEKYLVYATAFGMADKVIKQLKIVYPELKDDEYFNTYGCSTMYLATHTDFSNSFSNAVSSGISSATSSGSGGGGGFSGGGGGGGGGGGCGGR
jgi:uncharacterized membrane protein